MVPHVCFQVLSFIETVPEGFQVGMTMNICVVKIIHGLI